MKTNNNAVANFAEMCKDINKAKVEEQKAELALLDEEERNSYYAQFVDRHEIVDGHIHFDGFDETGINESAKTRYLTFEATITITYRLKGDKADSTYTLRTPETLSWAYIKLVEKELKKQKGLLPYHVRKDFWRLTGSQPGFLWGAMETFNELCKELTVPCEYEHHTGGFVYLKPDINSWVDDNK